MKQILSILALAIILIGCTTPQLVEKPAGSGNFVTEHTPDPRLTNAVGTIGAINDATAGVNPFHALIGLALTTVTAGATLIAKLKNDRANQANKLLTVVVQGVEAADDSDVKEAIHNLSKKVGVEGALSTAVAKITA